MRDRVEIIGFAAVAAAVLVVHALAISSANNESSDDDYHLVRGLEFLRRDGGLVHRELNDPPLGQAITALPLLVMGGRTHGELENTAIYGQRYTPETAVRVVAVWRVVVLVPFVVVMFMIVRGLFGRAAGWVAGGLILAEPTVLAHVHLASLDVLATGAIIVACWLGWRAFEMPTRGRIVAAAAGCAGAMLIKHTAVVVPVVFSIYALCGMGFQPMNRRLRTLATLGLLTVIAMWPLLLFDVSPVGTRPLPGGLYVKSVLDARAHAAAPNDAFLHGEIRRGGWWYYFPVVAAYKIPLGIATIIALGLLSLIWRRPRREELMLAVPLVVYAIFAMVQPIQIGWRHFLPAYVLAIMLAARGLTNRLAVAAGVIALAVTATESARWHPDLIGYVNFPRADVHLKISDSNIDWGQSLRRAGRWIDENRALIGDRPVYVRPVCASNRTVRHYVGERAIHLRYGDVPPRRGLVIISPVCLSGLSESRDEWAFLRQRKPIARIGRTLLVFDCD